MSALTDALNEYFPTILPAFKVLTTILIIICIFLFILQIAWVVKDALLRSKNHWWLWSLLGLIPLFGLLIYLVVRPSMYASDREEQNLTVEVASRELDSYGNCHFCGGPIEKDFIVCPWCQRPVKNKCSKCGKALHTEWQICPYCGSRPSAPQSAQRPQVQRPALRPAPAARPVSNRFEDAPREEYQVPASKQSAQSSDGSGLTAKFDSIFGD